MDQKHWKVVLAIFASGIVAMGVSLALADMAMMTDKDSLDTGDQVMWVAPTDDGYGWSGPVEIIERSGDRFQILHNGEAISVHSTDIMPIHVYRERQQAKEQR